METNYRRYPIGIQNFEQLSNNHCVYVDKLREVLNIQISRWERIYGKASKIGVNFDSATRTIGDWKIVKQLPAL